MESKYVACHSEYEAKKLLEYWHSLGYSWLSGRSLLEKTEWKMNSDNVYRLYDQRVTHWCMYAEAVDFETYMQQAEPCTSISVDVGEYL